MSAHSVYKPQHPFMQWLERRLPIASLVYSSFVVYPTPRNLNYWWTFGGILTFMLGAQMVTGIVLAMHYTPHVDLAFNSVESIMRDVNYGWLLRYLHANGASFFFVAVYAHIVRGMYYGSYKEPREVLWILGVILFLLMVVTGFMGYVLPTLNILQRNQWLCSNSVWLVHIQKWRLSCHREHQINYFVHLRVLNPMKLLIEIAFRPIEVLLLIL